MFTLNKLKRIAFIKKLIYYLRCFLFLFYKNRILENPNWNLLKKYSFIAQFHRNHRFYEAAISKYDNISFSDVEGITFLANGAGSNSLNSYRIVNLTIGDKQFECFEKIYLSDSIQLKKVLWFYKVVYPQIEKNVSCPEIRLIKGDKISIVYFEWIKNDNKSFQETDMLTFYCDQLFNSFKQINIGADYLEDDNYLAFKFDEMFIVSHSFTLLWLKQNYSQKEIDQFVEIYSIILNCRTKIFTHGDIGPSNIINNHLIDFDNCGMYVEGFEFATILYKSYKLSHISQLYDKLKLYKEKTKNDISVLPFLFFTFVFYAGKRAIILEDALLKELFTELVNHYHFIKNP